MDFKMWNRKLLGRSGILYPMLVSAAIAVIILSAVGVAAMTGMLPRADSSMSSVSPPHAESAGGSYDGAPPSNGGMAAADHACANCGVVESITPVEVHAAHGSGIGLVAGGVTGALLGNQIGHGSGNTLATIAGAAGGAYAGNEIEKHAKKSLRYQVRVRMNDGTYRTTSQSSQPPFAVGDRVRVVNGQVVAG